MKLKPLTVLLPCVSGLLLIGACKSTTSESSDGGQKEAEDKENVAPVDPMKAAHVFYSPDNKLPVGSILTSIHTMQMMDSKVLMTMGGRDIEGTSDRSGSRKTVTKITGENTIEVEFVEDKSGGSMTVMGQKRQQPAEEGALVGKTIVYTKKDGKWEGAFKNPEATEEQKKKLAEKIKSRNNPDEAAILGETPRKVGDSWDVDVSKLSSFGEGGVAPKGTFRVTFKGIEEYQGLSCAVLVADVDVTGESEEGMTIRLKGKSTVYQSLKYLGPLQNKLEGTMTISGKVQDGAIDLKMEGPTTMHDKIQLKLP